MRTQLAASRTSVTFGISALIALTVLLAASSLTPQAAAARLLTPLQARNQITGYFNHIYYGLVSPVYMKIQTETVRPGRLVIDASCDPSNPGFKQIDDSEANGQTLTQCQRHNGRYMSNHMARNKMPYTTQLHVTYAPLLSSLGERAATSAGIADTAHGTATYAYDTSTELDITYGHNPAAATATTKQLQQLRLHVQHGHESVQLVWYGR